MARQVTTYFHRDPSDLAMLRREHRKRFPGNELAILDGLNGSKLVKVAYPLGTKKPSGCLTMDEAKIECELEYQREEALREAARRGEFRAV